MTFCEREESEEGALFTLFSFVVRIHESDPHTLLRAYRSSIIFNDRRCPYTELQLAHDTAIRSPARNHQSIRAVRSEARQNPGTAGSGPGFGHAASI